MDGERVLSIENRPDRRMEDMTNALLLADIPERRLPIVLHRAPVSIDGNASYYRPHSSSASRFTAAASGFFILTQSGERPER
jgi:hypothetical protein